MMKYANQMGYTDVVPFEVMEERTPRKLMVRMMNSTLDPTWKPDMIPGGYSAHCANNHEQRYTYEPNPDQPLIAIRLHKNGSWYDKYKNRYVLSDRPIRFYDYNF